MARILIVDDEPSMLRVLATILSEDGHSVSEARGVAQALTAISAGAFDAVITDYRMQDGDGLSLLAAARETDPSLPIVVVTAYATVELAVEAMRSGAFDFVTKPFMPAAVLAVARRAAERSRLVRENARLRVEVERLGLTGELLGKSAAMRRVREQIERVAPTDATVLISGETGTGKELVARAIHRGSRRTEQPFVAVNCAALSETLLDSELFGHERGAFTGADRARQGLFEAAHRGTLFLDEAGEMPLALQTKLLRVLVDGMVLRVGSTSPRSVDVRVIVATHRDLERRVEEGRFREDLYFRLAVVPVAIAPLRERREDILLLARHFLQVIARELNVACREISRDALDRLMGYRFPGNVRELRNLIERAYILSEGPELGLGDFPIPGAVPAGGSRGGPPGGPEEWVASLPGKLDLRDILIRIEREVIARALLGSGGVQAEAARNLGLSRSDLAYKIRKHGLGDP